MEEILKFVAQMGVGMRHPHDEFLKEGNLECQLLKPYGICDYDNEEFYHTPYSVFSCHIPGCDRTFETIIEYESHYNSCHSFTCNECNKNLPNYHLLDLHISETHDSFFLELAKRKPMFQCFVEECKEIFANPKIRLDHCITVHKYPSDFRFDAFKKLKNIKKKKKNFEEKMEISSEQNSSECSAMDVAEENLKNKNIKKYKINKKNPTVLFGMSQRKRKSVFHNFSKDLIDVLPQQ